MKLATLRLSIRLALAALYLGAGVLHLSDPAPFVAITPDWVPHPGAIILVTGLCEIAGAIALFTPLRKAAGAAFALYAICVYPANVKHAIDHIHVAGLPDSWWYHGPRLALQPVLVWAALFCVGLISWPFTGTKN